MSEHVILLHGLGRDPSIMQSLADHFSGLGYQTHNVGYASRSYPIATLAEQVYEQVRTFFSASNAKVHCVGHSLGALVIRLMIQRYQPENLGRVVMIAPPNEGTPLVDFLKRFGLYRRYYGPAGLELGTDEVSIRKVWKAVSYELGVVAGDSAYWQDWLFSRTVVPRPNDGKVPVESTKVAGMRDHLVLPVAHPLMPNEPSVIAQVAYFVKSGQFLRGSDPLKKGV